MHFLALATDYDGTLAENSVAPTSTVVALERLKASRRKLIMVTGRPLDDLKKVFAPLELFDWVVAENGGLLYEPASRIERVLTLPPNSTFVETLRARGVSDLAVGRSVIATWLPFYDIVRATIAEMRLDVEIILNTDAVMILPKGTNKATGLKAALKELNLAPERVVAIGDAENDQVLLEACGCGVAVANGLAPLKRVARLVTAGERGAGVEELVALLIDREHELVQLSGGSRLAVE